MLLLSVYTRQDVVYFALKHGMLEISRSHYSLTAKWSEYNYRHTLQLSKIPRGLISKKTIFFNDA